MSIFQDLYEASCWAQDLLSGQFGDWVILDTETTGLSKNDEIIDLAIISKYGSEIINTSIKPTCPISPEASAVHGIQQEDLVDAPTWDEVYPAIKKALSGKLVVIYNAAFDCQKLRYMCDLNKLPTVDLSTACAMRWYAQYYGDWNDYFGNYKWQKLPHADHSAKGDCLATYRLIKKMAIPHKMDVEIVPASFPPRQISCRWERKYWLSVELNNWDYDATTKEWDVCSIWGKDWFIPVPIFEWIKNSQRVISINS